ncbi:hypothetical protein AB0M11_06840 [Streptomyces sp. NPDC051987]|uniref:hypothetical protein n=1 Tax=Streptomyces sp. NPDC051987 TaxID=3155808 RepID=UPI00343B08C4
MATTEPFEDMERRQPAELVTLYELEPEVRDVIVEGSNDKAFFDWYLSQIDHRGNLIRVYAVGDRVYLPDGEVLDGGHTAGERGRVVRLAEILNDLAPDCTSALMIADSDYASIALDKKPEIPGLFFTDYASLESYTLSDHVIDKLLRVVFAAPAEISAPMVLRAIKDPLTASFLIGACLREADTGAAISPKAVDRIPLATPCPDDVIREVFRISLKEKAREISVDNLTRRYGELRKSVTDDFRNFVRGHDIAHFVVKFLKENCKRVFTKEDGRRRGLQSPELLEIALMSCLEYQKLRSEKLFAAVELWLSRASATESEPPGAAACA